MTEVSRFAEILLVEDNETDVLIARAALNDSTMNCNLHVVDTADRALSFLRRERPHENAPRPDLVLLDWNLPGKSGADVLREMKSSKILRRIPTLVLATSAHGQDIHQAYDLHANSYIPKPLSIARFREVLQNVQQYWLSAVALPGQAAEVSIRVLLVTDNRAGVLQIGEALAKSHEAKFELASVTNMAECEQQLERGAFDVILADLSVADSSGLTTFLALREKAPEVPIIVLTEQNVETARAQSAQLGAQEYLPKGKIEATLLGRLIHDTVERHRYQSRLDDRRQREQHNREVRSITGLSQPAVTSVTAKLYGAVPLRESHPLAFRDLLERYGKALEKAMEERIYKAPPQSAELLVEMGTELGLLRAGPRDVIEIHTACVRQIVAAGPPARAETYLEEARLLVLKLMGHLASFYRNYYPLRKREVE